MLTNDRIKTVRIQEGCSAIHRSDLFPPNKSYSHGRYMGLFMKPTMGYNVNKQYQAYHKVSTQFFTLS